MNLFCNRLAWGIFFLFYVTTAYPQGKHSITGNKKLFDRIIRRMEENLDRNYFVDSLQPVRYSEYTYVDSSKHLLNAVYIEGIKRPVWFADNLYYKKKYGMDALLPVRYWNARLYEETPGEHYGSILFEEAVGYTLFISEVQNSLAQHIATNAQRRREREEKRNMDFNRTQLGNPSYTIDKRITSLDSRDDFQVMDTLYNNQPCYKLVRTYENRELFGQKEAERFEQNYPADNEENKELRRLVDLWGNAVHTGKVVRIIGKADYALLSLHVERFSENATGKFLVDTWEDKFEKIGNHYIQVLYKACTRRRISGTMYVNDQGIYTYRIKQPFHDAPPIEAAQTCQNKKIAQPSAGYEDFCTRVATPDEEMLEEWEKRDECAVRGEKGENR